MANNTNVDKNAIWSSRSFFNGGALNIAETDLTPYSTGYTFYHWVKLPSWFAADPYLKHFKNMFEKNTQEYSGPTDVQYSMIEHNSGFNNNPYKSLGAVTKGNDTFTTSHQEFFDLPMTKAYEQWLTLMKDPDSGRASYPEKYGVPYGPKYETGVLLVITVRPDYTNINDVEGVVQTAALYTNVRPNMYPRAFTSHSNGSQETTKVEQTFDCVPHFGRAITAYAVKVLRDEILSGDNSRIFIGSQGVTSEEAVADIRTWSNTLADVYGSSIESTSDSEE